MTRLPTLLCTLLGLLAITGLARGQEDRGDLPEGIRQLIRAADEAEQRVRQANGVAVDPDAERQARRGARAAKTAIRDYWLARFDVETARRDAAEAQTHFLEVKAAPVPDAARLQNAETIRDKKLDAVADAEFSLEQVRQAAESARRTSTPAGATSAARPATPPELPVPDYGSPNRVVTDSSRPSWRLVYRNDQGSYHLVDRIGTASYYRAGMPHLDMLDFVKETPHFFFYRPRSGDPTIIEWAFAKFAEFPAGDGEPMFAVWRHNSDGWHWEWSRRELPLVEMPNPPVPAAPPMPGPASARPAPIRQSPTLLANQLRGAR
jgi:hypothetical protein